MHQFGWLSGSVGGDKFLNLLQKERVPRKGRVPSEKWGGSNPGGNYVSRGPKVPDSTGRVTYLSVRIHPKCCLVFPLKVETLLSGSWKGTVRSQ